MSVVALPVVGEFWTDPCPLPADGLRWCLDEHDAGGGRAPFDCTRPAGHEEHDDVGHVAGGEGVSGTPGPRGRARRLKVYGVWA